MTLAAGIASLAGPTVFALSETGHLGLFESAPISPMLPVAALAAFGAGVGVVAICGGAKIAGVFCLLANASVFVLYRLIVKVALC